MEIGCTNYFRLGDLRDPKITPTPDRRLMLTAAATRRSGSQTSIQSLVWFSTDGDAWGEPTKIGHPGVLLWRPTWHKDLVYSVGYMNVGGSLIRLYQSQDGRNFEVITDGVNHDTLPNKTSLIFDDDDTCYSLYRCGGKAKLAGMGTSNPPYKRWQFKELNFRLEGPDLIQLPEGRVLAAGRAFDQGRQMALFWLDTQKAMLTKILELPSGGDMGYPGLVYDNSLLWVSYYSSHEGKSSIYLAKVALPERVAQTSPPPDDRPPPLLAVAPFHPEQAKQHQQRWAAHLGVPVVEANTIGMKLTLVPPGEFDMGSSPAQIDQFLNESKQPNGDRIRAEGPLRRVKISQPYYLGTHEVTLGQFRKFVEATGHKTDAENDRQGGVGFDATTAWFENKPEYRWENTGFPQTDEHPVGNVSWNDAVAFCRWLGAKTGESYRLPTAAEWEYACRAGTTSIWSGTDDETGLKRVANLAEGSFKTKTKPPNWVRWQAWDDAYPFSAPVGSFQPNAFGLFDMHGNVWEWCSDWYSATAYGSSTSQNPQGPNSGVGRVFRGGGWSLPASRSRAAYRGEYQPAIPMGDGGFRVVRNIQPPGNPVLPEPAAGNWIDVIPIIDPARDRFDLGSWTGKNDWRVENEELVYYPDGKVGKLLFPLVLKGSSLEWEIEFTRTNGDRGFNTDVPAKSGFVPVAFMTQKNQINLGVAARTPAPRFSLSKNLQVQTGKRYRLRVRVTRVGSEDHVELFIDNQPVGSWRGNREEIAKTTVAGEDYATNERLGLFIHRETGFVFHRIRLRMLEGEAHPLR